MVSVFIRNYKIYITDFRMDEGVKLELGWQREKVEYYFMGQKLERG